MVTRQKSFSYDNKNYAECFHLLLLLLLLLLQELVTSQSDHHPGCRLQLLVPEKYLE